MNIVVFGANGPTGLELTRRLLAAGHSATAAVRRPVEFPFRHEKLTAVKADVMSGETLLPVNQGAHAVMPTLGSPYTRKDVRRYSVSSKAIVDAMREDGSCKRLVVVLAGLTYAPPKVFGFLQGYRFPAVPPCLW